MKCPFYNQNVLFKVHLGRHLELYHAEQLSERSSDVDPVEISSNPFRSPAENLSTYTTNSVVYDDAAQLAEHTLPPPESLGAHGSHSENSCLPLEVMEFFERFGDSSEDLYPDLAPLDPPMSVLIPQAAMVLRYCTTHQLTLGEGPTLF